MKGNRCAANCLLLRRARHETLNLLTPLKIHLKLLERMLPEGEGRERAERALKLVDRLSQEVRFWCQVTKLQPEPLRHLNQKIIEAWSCEQEREQVPVQIQYRDVAPSTLVMATPHQLLTLVINLLRNAARFSPPGGKIILSYHGEGGLVKVSVADQGPGFTPVGMSEKQTTLEEDHGHGLQICQQIAGNHGSDLVYRNLAGGGCEVYFFLQKYYAGDTLPNFLMEANGTETLQPAPVMVGGL